MIWPTTKNGDYLVLRTVSPDWTSRVTVGYVGEGGIEANVPYRCERGRWVRAS